MRCLVLNADYTFLGVCDWKDAVCSVYTNKATVEESYEQVIHSPTTRMPMPAVIRLRKFVHVVFERINQVSYNKRNVHLRDNYTCQYCAVKIRDREATIDHVIPYSKGGLESWENTVTCCKRCNRIKDSKTPFEAGLKLLRPPAKPKGFREIMRIKLGELHDLWLKYL
ncbi:MAG: HNH endonuclease [Candidatus Omnitrophica bacterium]|nr:HNH endonuclease [Candidatus Omnitrophota bacterium]